VIVVYFADNQQGNTWGDWTWNWKRPWYSSL